MHNKRNKIESEYWDDNLKGIYSYSDCSDNNTPHSQVHNHKQSVFTKDNIKYIYKNYNDYSSSTIDTTIKQQANGYMRPYLEMPRRRVRSKLYHKKPIGSIPENFREKLSQDAYTYEYAQYMQNYLDGNMIPSSHCEPICSETYYVDGKYPDNYLNEYFRYLNENPNFKPYEETYPEPTNNKIKEKIHSRRRLKEKKYKKQLARMYLTKSNANYLLNEQSTNVTKKSVISCGAQTDFSKRSSTTSTQTEYDAGMWENWFNGNSEKPLFDSYASAVARYSKYIFVAGLAINLIRLYSKM